MTTMTPREFALALARPLVRRAGNDESILGGVADPARATQLLEGMWGASRREIVTSLTQIAPWGAAIELQSYLQAAQTSSWKPHDRDVSKVRKARTAKALAREIGERALLGWDLSRHCVVAGWAVVASIIDESEALHLLTPLFEQLLPIRTSFSEVAREVALGHQWVFGAPDNELDCIVQSLEPLAWPSKLAKPKRARAAKEPVSMTIALSVDCPACATPVHFRAICDGETCQCGQRVAMTDSQWAEALSSDVRRCTKGDSGDREVIQAFDDDWFPRRSVLSEPPRCPRCDGWLAMSELQRALDRDGLLACPRCDERLKVRAADATTKAIHPKAVAIVGEGGFAPRPTETRCLACGAGLVVDGRARIVRCACGARNWVADDAWARVVGPVRRPRWLLLVAV